MLLRNDVFKLAYIFVELPLALGFLLFVARLACLRDFAVVAPLIEVVSLTESTSSHASSISRVVGASSVEATSIVSILISWHWPVIFN